MSAAQSSEPVSFRAPIELGGKTATGIEVPQEVVAALEVTVAPDFAAALDADADARRHFDAMAYSHRLRRVLSVEDAKTDETRRRRIAKAVATLREGRRP